jgi:hypothetical protein
MTVQYRGKSNFKVLELVTRLLNTSHDNRSVVKNIYKIQTYEDEKCVKYIIINENVKYIGYFNSGIFYIVNITNDEFTTDEEFSESIKQEIADIVGDDNIPPFNFLHYSTNSKPLLKNLIETLKKVNNFQLINSNNHCHEAQIKNPELNDQLAILNEMVEGLGYRIDVDYVHTLETNSKVTSYRYIENNIVLLCIFKDNNCVSSLTLQIKNDHINIDSLTNMLYRGKHLNKILRAVIIIISKKISPKIKYITSIGANSISSYLMIKYFNAKVVNGGDLGYYDDDDDDDDDDDAHEREAREKRKQRKQRRDKYIQEKLNKENPLLFRNIENTGSIVTEVVLNPENIQNAMNEFVETVTKEKNKYIDEEHHEEHDEENKNNHGGKRCSRKTKKRKRLSLKKRKKTKSRK